MAIRSGFFNSVNGDRKYDAKRFAEYFATFIGNGVFPNPAANLQVISNNDMTITIKAGKAWINGYIIINDDDYILTLDPADGALNRIDRVVLRYDVVDREIRIEVKKGTFASTPVAKPLQRDADAYELGIADIRINRGAVSITQTNITDLRLSTEFCGIVHGLVEQVDTEVLFQDYQVWIEQKKGEFNSDLIDYTTEKQQELDTWYDTTTTEFEGNFNAWFATIQDILDENVAGNLLGRINQLENSKGQPNGVASLDENAQIPFEQLGNVQYMKDFYGRGVLSIPKKDLYNLNKIGVEFDIFDFYKYSGSIVDSSTWKNESIQLKNISGNGRTREYVDSIQLLAHGGNTEYSVVGSYKPYDLTNIDYIEFDYSTSSVSYAAMYLGVQKELNQSPSAEYDFTKCLKPNRNQTRKKERLDVRDLSGEHYIKLVSFDLDNSGLANASLIVYGIKLITNGKIQFDKSNLSLKLKDTEKNGEINFQPLEIPTGFIDWYNINSLFVQPNDTNITFDIYDDLGNILKTDIKQGEILKLSNPIIVPKVTLSRVSVDLPSPSLKWVEIGYRGRGALPGTFFDLVDVNLNVTSSEIVVEIPENIDELEIMINCTTSSGALVNMRLNSDPDITTHNTNAIAYSSSSSVTGFRLSNSYFRFTDASTTTQNIIVNLKGIKEGYNSNGFFFRTGTGNSSDNSYGTISYSKKDKIRSVTIFTPSSFVAGSKFKVRGR